MSLSPAVTLIAQLQNLSGPSGAASKLKISLVNFGTAVPSIPGFGVLGTLTQTVPFVNGALTLQLWGNDVISPAGTFYLIQLLDTNGNVTAAQNYQFTGLGAVDLSSVTPYNPGIPSTGQITVVTLTSFGVPGAPGTVTASGTNGAFNVPGKFTTGNTRTGISGPVSTYGPDQDFLAVNGTFFGPGWSLGNSGGWSVSHGVFTTILNCVRGISQAMSTVFNRHAVGDTAGAYVYVNSDGGATAQSDEGVVGANFEVSENSGYFHGTVSATTGTGDQQPTLAFSSGNNWTTDGAFLLNISKGTIAGSLNGASTAVTSYLKALPVTGVSLPLTTAWGTIPAAITFPGFTADINTPITLSINLGLIGGTAKPFTTGLCQLSGPWYPEQAVITAASAVLAGVQTITVAIRNPQAAGAIVFQGGIAGQFISFDANLAFSKMRSSYYAFGSLTGSDLIYGSMFNGSIAQPIPSVGYEAATTSGANAGFHLYPGAEITANLSTGYTPRLEPNAVVWTAGDIVENPHHTAFMGNGVWVTKQHNTPCHPSYNSFGLRVDAGGQGINPGFTGLYMRNNNPPTNYKSSGGPILGPCGIQLVGPWDNTIYLDQSPAGTANGSRGGSLIQIQTLANNVSAAAWTGGNIAIVNFNSVGSGSFSFNPTTATYVFTNLSAYAATINTATITTLNVTGSTTFPSLTVTGAVTTGSLTASGNLSTPTGGVSGNYATFSNFVQAVTFNATNAFVAKPVNAATASNNYQSASIQFQGSYWNGSAAVTSQSQIQLNFAAGTNPAATLSFGSVSGAAYTTIQMPGLDNTAIGSHTPGTAAVTSLAVSITTKTGNYTFSNSDHTVLANAASGAQTQTLPPSPALGQFATVKKIDASANAVTVSGNGRNIDGGATQLLSAQYAVLRVQYDGTQWWAV